MVIQQAEILAQKQENWQVFVRKREARQNAGLPRVP